jgi:cellulose biosynthesis protein BcsQ
VLPSSESKHKERIEKLRAALHEALGHYSAGPERVLFSMDDVLDPGELNSSEDMYVWQGRDKAGEPCKLQVIDRLLTNQDWIRKPLRKGSTIPVIVGYSIKGGVGRSTALAVLAVHLSRRGKRVLVVDLDLEAPGIGRMLTELPTEYGLTDWLVEAVVGQADADLLSRCLVEWTVDSDIGGSLHVLPALGESSESYISKLGRVYTPSISAEGNISGFADRLNLLITILEATGRFDIILIDSRAGLHDIGSAAVTQLGAKVLMFARDDPQTWEGYAQLFAHLRYSKAISWHAKDNPDDLRWRLKMVGAQMGPEERERDAYIERSFSTWLEIYDEENSPGDQAAFTFSRNDLEGPHYPMFIAFDPRVKGFNLASRDHLPAWEVVIATFGTFLESCEKWLGES